MNMKLRLIALIGILLCSLELFAIELNSNQGFFIDLPEEFSLTQSDGSSKFTFMNAQGTIVVDIIIYSPQTYTSIDALAGQINSKLQAKSLDAWSFDYAGRKARIHLAQFQNNLQGYILTIDSLEPKKLPDGEKNFDFVLLAYTKSMLFKDAKPVLESIIDGFSLRFADRLKPGPFATAMRTRIKPLLVTKQFSFAGTTFTASYDKNYANLVQEIVEREYQVLLPYGAAPNLVEDAVRRFYRQIYRISYSELAQLSLLFSQAWERQSGGGITAEIGQTIAKSTEPHFGIPADPLGYVKALLAWVQQFTYVRNQEGSDVVNPITAAYEATGDCDSRVLVMTIFLDYEHIDAILMISLVHEHALIGVGIDGKGAKYPYLSRMWLIGETTAPVELGLIDKQQSNIEDWFGIDFK